MPCRTGFIRFGITTSRIWLVWFIGDMQNFTSYFSLINKLMSHWSIFGLHLVPGKHVSHISIFWALFVLGFKTKSSKSGKRALVSPGLHRKSHCTAGNLAWNIKTQKNVVPSEDLGPCKKTFFWLKKKWNCGKIKKFPQNVFQLRAPRKNTSKIFTK